MKQILLTSLLDLEKFLYTGSWWLNISFHYNNTFFLAFFAKTMFIYNTYFWKSYCKSKTKTVNDKESYAGKLARSCWAFVNSQHFKTFQWCYLQSGRELLFLPCNNGLSWHTPGRKMHEKTTFPFSQKSAPESGQACESNDRKQDTPFNLNSVKLSLWNTTLLLTLASKTRYTEYSKLTKSENWFPKAISTLRCFFLWTTLHQLKWATFLQRWQLTFYFPLK